MVDSESLETFKSFTSCPDDALAVKFIEGAGGNVENAVNQYFDNPNRHDQFQDVQTQGYDAGVWEQDRYGQHAGGSMPSFQIHPYDEGTTSYDQEMATYNTTKSSAPTRPNSRQSESSMRAQISPQESGIIGNAVFGPANRDHYDPSQWSLTLPEAVAVEILPEVDVFERLRGENEPALIRPLGNPDPFAAFMTVLGQIPLTQKAFVELGPQLANYGKDSEWWKGTPIELAETVIADETVFQKQGKALIYETQRIMAFLLESNRLYASLEPMIKLDAIKEAHKIDKVKDLGMLLETNVDRFVVAWSNVIEEYNLHAAHLFRTEVEGEQQMAFYAMKIMVDDIGGSDPQSLYDAVDNKIWARDMDGVLENDLYLSSIPPILILRLVRNSKSLNLDIPAAWYLDRYLKENWGPAKDMRKSMTQHRQLLKQIWEQKNALEATRTSSNQSKTTSSMLESAIEYLRRDFTKIQLDGDEEEDMEVDEEDEEDVFGYNTDPLQAQKLADDLEKIHSNLRGALTELEEQRVATMKKLQELSQLLKAPTAGMETDDQLIPEPKHRYQLRGFTTHHRNVYVLDTSADEPSEHGWWKYEYTTQPLVTRDRISEEQALQAAREDSGDVVLIYASDPACAPVQINMPQPLQQFILDDNEFLQREKQDAEINESQWPVNEWQGHQATSTWENIPHSSDGDEKDGADEKPPPYDDDDDDRLEEMSGILHSDALQGDVEVTQGIDLDELKEGKGKS